MKRPENILLVRTDRIGDVVLTLPLAKIIKQHYPGCRISFLVREYTKPLVMNNPYVDEVLTLHASGDSIPIKENLDIIKLKKFDTAVIVYPRFTLALILYLAGIKNRIGTGYRWYSFLFNNKIYEHRKYAEKHELEYNLQLLKKIGIEKINGSHVSFDIHFGKESEQRIEKIFDEYHIDRSKKTIIVHPGSGGSSIDLPFDKMKDLVNRLARGLKYNILITGSEKEKPVCSNLVLNNSTVNLAGFFDLDELTALISKSDMLIANSTGPIHIAAALDKYVAGFYPKVRECSVKRWGPYTDKKIVFEPETDCENCTRKQCQKLNCMNSIDINKVEKSILNLLN